MRLPPDPGRLADARSEPMPRACIQVLADALPEAVLFVDQSQRIRIASQPAAALFGHTVAALVDQPVDMLVPPHLRARHAALYDEFFRAPRLRPVLSGHNIHGLTQDGQEIPLAIGLGILATEDGPMAVVSLHDMSGAREDEHETLSAALAQKAADMRRLHEMATRLLSAATLPAMLAEMLASAMDLQDADLGTLRLFDPATRKLTIAARHGVSAGFVDRFRHSSADDNSIGSRALRLGKRVVVEDFEADRLSAPYLAAARVEGIRAGQATPILARDGSARGALSTYFRHPHRPSGRELHLTDLWMRMASEIVERAQTEQALAEARLAAERASHAKSRFLAAANHELRQPLQTLLLLLGVLQRQVASTASRTTLARIEDATMAMTGLVDELTFANHVEEGTIRVALADVAAGPVLRELADHFMPLAEAKGLRLRVVPSSLRMRTDRRLLGHMLARLVSNAIKYTQHGKILVGCRHDDGALRIEVWTTGAGIPVADIDAPPDAFHQLDGPANAGPGLGLYIAKRLADRLECRIGTFSGPGTVSRLTVFVPVVPPPAARWDVGPSDDQPVVLLVLEEPVQRDALRLLLEHEGYGVVAAGDLEGLLTALMTEEGPVPAAIVTEAGGQRGTEGLDLIQRIRALLGADIPAIAISESGMDIATWPDAPGAVTHAAKPLRPDALLAALHAALGTRAGGTGPHGLGETRHSFRSLPRGAEQDIAVIDDDPAVGEAVCEALVAQGRTVQVFASGEAFLATPGRGNFRLVLMDLSLPDMNGLALLRRLRSEQPATAVIFLTGDGDLSGAVEVMREGAADFLEKPVQIADLLASIERAPASRQAPHPAPHAAPDDVEKTLARERLATLTKRELEVLDLILVGQLNKNIAADLGISERTTEHHRQSVMRKLGVRSVAMLVRMTVQVDEVPRPH
ncbi:response regulator [Sphingomonas sp.]|uniref:response regulator n=1 Tax=Sphingomonas sp. TaxID=28214 RepID=UPI0035B09793